MRPGKDFTCSERPARVRDKYDKYAFVSPTWRVYSGGAQEDGVAAKGYKLNVIPRNRESRAKGRANLGGKSADRKRDNRRVNGALILGAIYKDGIPILLHPFVDTVAIDVHRRKRKAPARKKRRETADHETREV
jgi:hypothetical protein